jgi:hypothetical protein
MWFVRLYFMEYQKSSNLELSASLRVNRPKFRSYLKSSQFSQVNLDIPKRPSEFGGLGNSQLATTSLSQLEGILKNLTSNQFKLEYSLMYLKSPLFRTVYNFGAYFGWVENLHSQYARLLDNQESFLGEYVNVLSMFQKGLLEQTDSVKRYYDNLVQSDMNPEIGRDLDSQDSRKINQDSSSYLSDLKGLSQLHLEKSCNLHVTQNTSNTPNYVSSSVYPGVLDLRRIVREFDIRKAEFEDKPDHESRRMYLEALYAKDMLAHREQLWSNYGSQFGDLELNLRDATHSVSKLLESAILHRDYVHQVKVPLLSLGLTQSVISSIETTSLRMRDFTKDLYTQTVRAIGSLQDQSGKIPFDDISSHDQIARRFT